jgi:hypothetical protein
LGERIFFSPTFIFISNIIYYINNGVSDLNIIRLKSLLKEDGDEFVQIKNLPVTAFVSRFKDISSDPKVQSIIRAGLTDGKPNDEKITFTSKQIPAKNLIPTQREIGQNESLVNILNDKYNSLDSFLDGLAKFKSPIVTLNSKYIIDGHHRWSQAYIANPDVKVPIYDMTATIKPEEALKAMHIAIAANTKTLPLSSAKGTNLYTTTQNNVENVVKSNLTDRATKLYDQHNLGGTESEISAYLWRNIQNMQKNNKPISSAPPRTSMPQAGDSNNYDDLLSRGIVNFKDPKKSDVKTEAILRLRELIRRIK